MRSDDFPGRAGNVVVGFDRRLGAIARAYGVAATRLAFAFVFLTFGAQKVLLPAGSPVDGTIMTLATIVWFLPCVSIEWVPAFVGAYELLLGLCFLRNRLFAAAVLFVPHQLVSFAALALTPALAFAQPSPLAYDMFGAFVLKNVVFVGAFLLLYADRDGE